MSNWEKVLNWILRIVVLSCVLWAAYYIRDIKDQQIKISEQLVKNLENQSFFWKERSKLLKDNLNLMNEYAGKMKIEKDKLVDKLSQDMAQDNSIRNIESEFDNNYDEFGNIYQKTIPLSSKIN